MLIGFLHVCGPNQKFYEQLLTDFTDIEKLSKMEESMTQYQNRVLLEDIYENSPQMVTSGTELGEAPTEPENNSSTVLWTKYDTNQLLFTADAGIEALMEVKKKYYGIGNLRWMQIPHHGSRRNINEELINFFKPKTAFVSADGSKKHPRRAVVNAFNAIGSKVYSTHYPSPANKWFSLGVVPPRPDYSAAIPLYEAEKTATVN